MMENGITATPIHATACAWSASAVAHNVYRVAHGVMTGGEYGWIAAAALILNLATATRVGAGIGIGIGIGIEIVIGIMIEIGIVAVTFRLSTVNPAMENVIGVMKASAARSV